MQFRLQLTCSMHYITLNDPRDNLESDTLFFERVLEEEKRAGRIGDVAG